MTLAQAFDELPKSERTIFRHKFNYKGIQLINDTDYGPCFYRVVVDGIELGAVYYYGGRKLASYEFDQ